MSNELDKLAREIAASQKMHHADEIHITRLGILRGLEMAAGIARRYRDEAGGSESYRRACEHIEKALHAVGGWVPIEESTSYSNNTAVRPEGKVQIVRMNANDGRPKSSVVTLPAPPEIE